MKPLPKEADDLFAAPLAEFVKRRDRLAKELAQRGSAQEAQAVRALRKPTVATWAMNQAARRSPEKVKNLLGVYRTLREADSAAALRQASARRQEAVRAVVDAVREALESSGHSESPSLTDKVTRTLLAMATDERAQLALSGGHLTGELEPVELDFGAGGAVFMDSELQEGAGDRELREALKRASRLAKEVDELSAQALQLEARAADAQRVLEEAQKEVERFREKAGKARAREAEKRQEAESAARLVTELEGRTNP